MALTVQMLVAYLCELSGIDEPLSAESPLFSTGLLDSMTMLNLIAFVEERAGIQVRAEDVTLDNFDTPARIARYALGMA